MARQRDPRHSECPDSPRDSLLTAGVHTRYVRPATGMLNWGALPSPRSRAGRPWQNQGTICDFHLLFVFCVSFSSIRIESSSKNAIPTREQTTRRTISKKILITHARISACSVVLSVGIPVKALSESAATMDSSAARLQRYAHTIGFSSQCTGTPTMPLTKQSSTCAISEVRLQQFAQIC